MLESQDLIDLVVTEQVPEQLPSNAMLVLDRPKLNHVPDGSVIVVSPALSTSLWEIGEPLTDPLVAKQDASSPFMRHVDLTNVQLPTAQSIRPLTDADVLVESIEGAPLYTRFHRDSGDILVLTVDLESGDLPLRTSFPILITNALNELSGNTGNVPDVIASGQSTRIDLPASFLSTGAQYEKLKLVAPDGTSSTAVAVGGKLTHEFDQTGVWSIVASDLQASGTAGEMAVACSLVSSTESDLRTNGDASEDQVTTLVSKSFRPPWFYLLVASICLTTIDWYCFHRRWVA